MYRLTLVGLTAVLLFCCGAAACDPGLDNDDDDNIGYSVTVDDSQPDSDHSMHHLQDHQTMECFAFHAGACEQHALPLRALSTTPEALIASTSIDPPLRT
jgi:hypothetical protein